MSKTQLTRKQEAFCLNYFELGNASEAARLAKYSPKTAGQIAINNLCKPAIKARLAELEAMLPDPVNTAVATVQERKEILTEIARGKLTDFMEAGMDGSWINIDNEKMNSRSIRSIDSKTEYDEETSQAAVLTKITLHDPIRAINELNKMEHIHTDGPVTNILNVNVMELTDEQLTIIAGKDNTIASSK